MTRAARTTFLILASALAAACDDPTSADPVADIEIHPMPMMLAIGETVRLEAQPVSTSGRELDRRVRWSTSAASVATVSAGGLLTALDEGEVTLTATSEGVSASFIMEVVPVAATSLQMEAGMLDFLQGSTVTIEAIVKNAQGQVVQGLPVEWTSRNEAVATVDQAGNIQMVGPGVTYVVARYGALKDSTHVTVRPLPPAAAR